MELKPLLYAAFGFGLLCSHAASNPPHPRFLLPNFLFLIFNRHTASALLHQERTQVVCGSKEAWKRLAQIERHSRK